jgi:Glycosyl hydrolase family 115/Gylcosyl hydrolase family 115 C-terminal domain
LRLRANYLWPAMHPGTPAFNSFPTNKELADAYGIVMGSSHCEQMLRDNVDEWKQDVNGEYNYVVNRDGVLKFWEQRVRENGKFDNVYTLGMRGIHDGAMPGGGTEREKAARLHHIIADQRELLARCVNTNVAQVPQIFCPYKEVLPLYRLAPDIPDDITLVWPDDNYGYVRQFSNERERRRGGGAGVYYHVSYWGGPRDYLWLCSTPPALIADEMSKAFDYGADKVWILNVGDLKPAELDIEFFLKLAWNPHAWNGTNTYDLLEKRLARDFGAADAAELSSILAEYYRLNSQRKPEHMGFNLTNTFSTTLNGDEVRQRLGAWRALARRIDSVERQLPAESHDAFFELIGYPVRAAALINEKALALMKFFADAEDGDLLAQAQRAENEIARETDIYNNVIAGGKWRGIMSSNPRGQVDFKIPPKASGQARFGAPPSGGPAPEPPEGGTPNGMGGADFLETNHHVVMEAEHASKFVPGKEAVWRVIRGLGYNGGAVFVFPTTAAVRATPEQIRAGSPCLKFSVWMRTPGDWETTIRALPTFSVEAGKPQRFAIAWDDAPPKIISLPVSQNEHDPKWQENVLRNLAEAADASSIAQPGLHTLNVWMVDPGIVIDEIIATTGGAGGAGYLGPAETRLQH